MPEKEEKVSNEEILEILKEMKKKNEKIMILAPEEVEEIRESLKGEILSDQDVKDLKELLQDRRAVSRVMRKGKTLLLALAGGISAYIVINEAGVNFIKKWLGVE